MSGADFQALAVLLVLAGGVVVVLLTISFLRRHRLVQCVTLAVLAAALAALGAAVEVIPRSVTPLLVMDGYALYFSALLVGAAVVTVLLSYRYLDGSGDDPEEYYLLVLAATAGAVTLAGASHFASLLLGLEIVSVSLYVLIAYPRSGHPPLEAALKYLILSGAASTTMLFGMALIYAATGTLAFVPPGAAAGDLYLTAGLVMLMAGAGFKLSLVPFHMWTPDVYQGAPAPVTGYLASVSKAAMFAVLLRYLLESGALADPALHSVLLVLAVLSMIVGNLLALRQNCIKRILAYSAIAHLGYLLIPLIALGQSDPDLAVEASLVYLGAYVVMTLAAFGVVTVLSAGAGTPDADALDHYAGLFWRRPGVAAVLTLVLLSLAGIPLTLGFIAKFYLFAAGVSAATWLLLIALVAGSGIGLYYYLRIVFAMTRDLSAQPAPGPGVAVSGRVTLGVLAVLLLAFGIYPAPLITLVRQALQSWGG